MVHVTLVFLFSSCVRSDSNYLDEYSSSEVQEDALLDTVSVFNV